MSDSKENKTIKTDPRYICAGASACLILIGIIVYKICESKMNIAVENLRSYYGSVDSGLFLTQQEYLLRQALLLSILIPVIVGIILLVALFVYLDRMIPASFKKSKTKETDVKVKDPRKKRPTGTNEKKTDLVELIGKVKDSYAHKMEEKNITFTVEDDDVEEPVVMCDAEKIEDIVKKLINNAYRSASEGGRVYMALKQFYVSDEGYGIYELTVEDDGTDKAGDAELSGADIEDAKAIAESLDGELETETVKGVGNGVTVRLDLKVIRDKKEATDERESETSTDL